MVELEQKVGKLNFQISASNDGLETWNNIRLSPTLHSVCVDSVQKLQGLFAFEIGFIFTNLPILILKLTFICILNDVNTDAP